MIDQDTIKKFFHYDPDTGVLTRIAKVNRHTGELYKCSIVVRNDNGNGYARVFIKGRRFLAHVLIYAYMTGKFPTEIDHVDGDKQNNRWVNLREVGHQTNMMNVGVYSNSVTGVPGVVLKSGKYVVTIQKETRRFYLGKFDSFIKAVSVRREAQAALGFHPNHGTRPSWRG